MGTKADYEQFFADADADKSGFLSLKELSDILTKRGYSGGSTKVEGFFASVDTSGDGKISKDEYMVAMGQQKPEVHNEAAMRRVFNSFDKDGSGQIDKADLKKVFEEMGKYFPDNELARMIELSDKDASGTLSYEEFIAATFGK